MVSGKGQKNSMRRFASAVSMMVCAAAAMLLASPFTFAQQISCGTFDEEQGHKLSEYAMKGCRSFNELRATGEVRVAKGRGIKSYACFATTFPEEGKDFFVFASLGGIMSFPTEKDKNGYAFMQTFLGGGELNDGYTTLTWTQYPKERPFLWSEGIWLGQGDAQMMTWSKDNKSLVPDPEPEPEYWKLLQIPRLHASVESDVVTLRLELNNGTGIVETLRFNRLTGRALLDFGDNQQRALRCVSID